MLTHFFVKFVIYKQTANIRIIRTVKDFDKGGHAAFFARQQTHAHMAVYVLWLVIVFVICDY